MARIFNIYFSYDDELRSAIVSVRTNPFFTEYILGNLDMDLRRLLPGESIVSDAPGKLFFKGTDSNQPSQLMTAILKSLATHLMASNVSS